MQVPGQRRLQPGGHGVTGLGSLSDQAFEPAQRLELALDQPRALAQALGGFAIGGLKGGDLLGLRFVLQALGLGKDLQARQVQRRIRNTRGVELHQARGAGPVLPPGGQRKLLADPSNGGAHDTPIGDLAFQAQVALPAVARIDALHNCAHEGEVADMQLALPRDCWPGAHRRAVARVGCRGVVHADQ